MSKKNLKNKVVVTGGVGFIGSNLVKVLIEKGFNVHIIDNLVAGEGHINKKARLHKVSITDYKKILPIIKGAEYVFHLAALPRVQYSIEFPQKTNEVNVDGTLNVLLAAKEGKVKKVIYSASSSAYGDQPIMPLREDMLAMPKSPYGLQKYYGELQCRLFSEVYNLPTVSLRYFNVYGPNQSDEGAYALVIAKFLKQVKDNKPMTITGDGKQTRDFTHVYDVVKANILAAESNMVSGEVINIGAGNNHSIKKIAELIGGKIEYIPTRLEPKDTLADNSKAKKLLGWKPEVSIEEGIGELKKILKIAKNN